MKTLKAMVIAQTKEEGDMNCYSICCPSNVILSIMKFFIIPSIWNAVAEKYVFQLCHYFSHSPRLSHKHDARSFYGINMFDSDLPLLFYLQLPYFIYGPSSFIETVVCSVM